MSRKQGQTLAEQMHAKEWRALPQTVSIIGLGPGGTGTTGRQFWMRVLKCFSFVALFSGIAALFVYVWMDMMDSMTGGDDAQPVAVEFVNDGGVLNEAWFRKWTAFDETNAPNLNQLRDRLLEYPQIRSARILRLNDGKIRIDIRERYPVARFVDESGQLRLVADDGILFPAETFPGVQAMLPLLQDVKVAPAENGAFSHVKGFAPVAEFLAFAHANYREQFANWAAISLKDIPLDSYEISSPWAVFRVIPRSTFCNPVQTQVSEIVFSADRFREDLRLFEAAHRAGQIEKALNAPGEARAPEYRILFITNRKNPNREFREMRIVPVAEATR